MSLTRQFSSKSRQDGRGTHLGKIAGARLRQVQAPTPKV